MSKQLLALLALAINLCAQDAANKISVPLSDPSRPAQVRATLMSGGITVRAAQTKEVTVEVRNGQLERRPTEVPKKAEGLKRLDFGASGQVDIEENNNSVNIQARHSWRGQDLVITVPVNTSVNLKTMNNGEILIEGLHGELAANNMNGKVTMRNVSGTILANSMNGDVTVTLDAVDADKPNSFSTMNGDIDVTMPAAVKARVKLKAGNGSVFSDFDIKPDASSSKPVVETGKGKYKVRFDQATFGTLNGGGPEYQFSTFNGNIMIRKK